MVRRRSTVRFRNEAPLKDQVRSSLDSSHPTLRMGAVPVLGGIWEIVFWEIVFFRTDSSSGPTELAWSAREGQPGGCRTPRRGEPGVTRWSQIRRRPCRVLSEITCASQVALRAAFSQYGVWVIRGNGPFPLIARRPPPAGPARARAQSHRRGARQPSEPGYRRTRTRPRRADCRTPTTTRQGRRPARPLTRPAATTAATAAAAAAWPTPQNPDPGADGTALKAAPRIAPAERLDEQQLRRPPRPQARTASSGRPRSGRPRR